MERLLLLAGVLVLAGCFERSDTPARFLDDGGTGGTPTTIAAPDGPLFDGEGGQPPACCVAGPTAPLQGPSWFEFGEPGALGPCPDPTAEGLTGYQELKVEPHTCGACSCSPAACTLPEGIHTNAAKCSDADGSIAIPFGPDPAAGWEGVCSPDGALPADLLCSGVSCIQSLSIPPLGVAPCDAIAGPAAPFPDPTWGRMARECKIEPLSDEGCAAGRVCVPPPPEGFSLCLYAEGEPFACPPDYPARTVFYRSAEDDRGCEECACSPPEGAQCMAFLSTFSDVACASPVVAVLVTADEPSCQDVPTGTALGSAEASMVTDLPGSCTSSGGAPFGGVTPADPFTLCCQIPPEPPG